MSTDKKRQPKAAVSVCFCPPGLEGDIIHVGFAGEGRSEILFSFPGAVLRVLGRSVLGTSAPLLASAGAVAALTRLLIAAALTLVAVSAVSFALPSHSGPGPGCLGTCGYGGFPPRRRGFLSSGRCCSSRQYAGRQKFCAIPYGSHGCRRGRRRSRQWRRSEWQRGCRCPGCISVRDRGRGVR